MTPTSASGESTHNKKNFTFVHCQSQILKRRVVRQAVSQLSCTCVRVCAVGEGGGNKRLSVSHSLWAKKYIYVYLPVKLAKSKEKTQQQQQRRRQQQQHSLCCASPCASHPPPCLPCPRPTHARSRHARCAHLFIGSASTSSSPPPFAVTVALCQRRLRHRCRRDVVDAVR